jgi:hypothetical protein
VKAVRLTNSRREIGCIRDPPVEVDEALLCGVFIVSEDRFRRSDIGRRDGVAIHQLHRRYEP